MSHSARPPLVVIPQFFGSLVFDRRTSRYMPFDGEATDVLRRLAERPFPMLLAAESADRHARLIDFYEYFYDRGFFTMGGRLAGEVLDLEPPDDHLAGPLAVHLEIIGACNLACSHCFAGALPRNDHPLTLGEIDGLCGELAALGSFRLGLTGGEPLLRRDLFEIIDCATGHGLHPCLTTNGLLINEQTAREFGRRELVWLNVSLDGATARSNDAIRGAGTYDRVLEKLRILRRHARFTLAFTITSANSGEVEACARLARDVGAHTAVFRPLYPVGVAQQHLHLMPTFQQYTDALRRLSSGLSGGDDLHAVDPFSPHTRRETQAKVLANNGCGAGNLVASVSVQGDVNPCSFLGPEFNAASIRECSFAEIWRHSQGFADIRGLSQPDGCGTCEQGGFRGGCRARALAFRGDIDRADPWHDEYLVQIAPLHPLSNVECVERSP